MCPNHPEHNHGENEECPMAKKPEVKLNEIVPSLIEVIKTGEEIEIRANSSITNEIIDERLKLKDAIRISNYKGMHADMTFRCKNCFHEWIRHTYAVVNHKSLFVCPECRRSKLDNEKYFKEMLKVRFIELVGEFAGLHNINSFRCVAIKKTGKECGHIWSANGYAVAVRGCGCYRCFHNIRTNEDIDIILSSLFIKRKSDYIGYHDPIDLECLICGKEWSPQAGSVIRDTDMSGCPRCKKTEPLTDEIIDKRIVGMPLKRISHFIKTRISVKWLCLNPKCNHKWETRVWNIFNGSGCPECQIGKNERRVKQLIIDTFVLDKIYKKKYVINGHNRKPDYTIKKEGKEDVIVEYNGIQHYFPKQWNKKMSWEEAEENFKIQVIRDKEVDDYFKSINTTLIWIKYDMTDEEIIAVLSNYLERKKI